MEFGELAAGAIGREYPFDATDGSIALAVLGIGLGTRCLTAADTSVETPAAQRGAVLLQSRSSEGDAMLGPFVTGRCIPLTSVAHSNQRVEWLWPNGMPARLILARTRITALSIAKQVGWLL